MRIGILGGIFNPPHIGHLVCAQEAHDQLGLDTVLLVPAREAPHRPIEHDPGPELRAEMCELAVAGDDRLGVSRIELERSGPSYTVETLAALEERDPDGTRVLIMGADQAAGLRQWWHQPEEVLERAVVAVAERDGARRESVRRAVAGLAGADRLGFFDMPRIDVSSTLVRERARRGRPIRYLVRDSVAELIERRALYRASATVGAD